MPASSSVEDAAARDAKLAELAKQSNSAGSALRIVAIVQFLSAVVIYLSLDMDGHDKQAVQIVQLTVGIAVGVGVLFLVLSFWSRRNPLPAVASGLVVYVTLIVLNAVADPSTLAKGILLRVLVLFALVKGLRAALQHRALQPAPTA